MVAPLDRKLLRDLGRIRGQAIAIGMVIAMGVLMLVMMQGLVTTLEETRRAYYERYRLAEVFAPVTRAPNRVLEQLKHMPGVSAVQGRIRGDALLDLPQVDVPIRALAVSLPDSGVARLNAIALTQGRLFAPRSSQEVVVLNSFAKARNLKPGDTLDATMYGSRKTLKIVGLAQSPEFLYSPPPGELVPDDGRFAVLWMSEQALSAAYDLDGAFNEALLALSPQAQEREVIDRLDMILDSYGSQGAYGLEDQVSNQFIVEEIAGVRASANGVPPIFMGVAAFLLYIVISRIVQSEREQIGLLKAFGYSSREVAWHYLKLVLTIAIFGAIAGAILGVAAGRSMAGLYQPYYKFPFLIFQVEPAAFIVGLLVSVAAATFGGVLVLRQVFALTPAVAMRPPTPEDYSRVGSISRLSQRFLDQPSRMVLRRLRRQPGRMLGAISGIAMGMALAVGMAGVLSGFSRTLDLTFSVVDRSDATVTFIHPVSATVLYELSHMPGILREEPYRTVPVVLRHGRAQHRGAIQGLLPEPVLSRALDAQQHAITLPADGIVLSRPVAKKLNLKLGDHVTVEVREGRRPTLSVPVSGIAQSLLGAPLYMSITGLNAALNEPHRVSGAYLKLDHRYEQQVYQALKNRPLVAGVSLKNDSYQAFKTIMDSGAGATRFFMAAIAAIITFGIVYNTARIAYAERARDLASLRVLGFTRSESAFVLLGELVVVTLLALPLGALLGYFLNQLVAAGFSTDLYQIPALFNPQDHGAAAVAVLVAALISGWLVKRQADGVDMVDALKSRE